MKFTATQTGKFSGPGFTARCVVGKGGVVKASQKREGDGASPAGTWPVRNVFFRPDRLGPPVTSLPLVPLKPYDGWCDAPDHRLYNRPVSLPFSASHEKLWRDDHVYDVIVELGYNDDPDRTNFEPTEGCIALEQNDLLTLLELMVPGAEIEISF